MFKVPEGGDCIKILVSFGKISGPSDVNYGRSFIIFEWSDSGTPEKLSKRISNSEPSIHQLVVKKCVQLIQINASNVHLPAAQAIPAAPVIPVAPFIGDGHLIPAAPVLPSKPIAQVTSC